MIFAPRLMTLNLMFFGLATKKKTKNIILTVLLIFYWACTQNRAVIAQNAKQENMSSWEASCENSLAFAVGTIERRNVRVVNLYASDLSEIYREYPRANPLRVLLVVEGESVEEFLFDEQFLLITSRGIINGCPGVGLVSFGMNATGWIVDFGLFDGQVRQFQCIPRSAAYEPTWGFSSGDC